MSTSKPSKKCQFEDLVTADNLKIVNHAIRPYVRFFEHDELEQLRLIAIWRASRNYDERKSKFSTHLYNIAKYTALDNIPKSTPHMLPLLDVFSYETPEELEIDFLPEKLQTIVKQRIWENMTLEEIGNYHGFSYEQARKCFNQALDLLRMVYNNTDSNEVNDVNTKDYFSERI